MANFRKKIALLAIGFDGTKHLTDENSDNNKKKLFDPGAFQKQGQYKQKIAARGAEQQNKNYYIVHSDLSILHIPTYKYVCVTYHLCRAPRRPILCLNIDFRQKAFYTFSNKEQFLLNR